MMINHDTSRTWDTIKRDTDERLAAAAKIVGSGKVVTAEDTVALLEAIIRPFDRVNIEGDNQKQADFLAQCLCAVDPAKVHDLHMVQSVLTLPEHLDVFEKGIAKKLDFSFSGPQSGRIAELLGAGKLDLGAIHTYLELYGRYFLDLTPRVALVVADAADREGNLYTGFSTEDTPTIVEATKFRQGIVVVQVNEIVDRLPRVDIPADFVDFIVTSPRPFYIEPLFTRDPAKISDARVLTAMMTIKGIYAEYGIQNLNHGVGYDTAAIELLLPTYGEELGLKGKICSNWILNPHPTLIPAIESGWVKSVHSFGGELGMERYVAARPDVFFIGPDGSMRSNRCMSQVAGHYAIDAFVGATLQIDPYGNSSTATATKVAGFGGAPNMGCDSRGRRHSTAAWLKAGAEVGAQAAAIGPDLHRGRRLVVQILNTVAKIRDTKNPGQFKEIPAFVEHLDAEKLMKNANLPIEPVMIYGDDLTHIVTEQGIAYLHRCRDIEERRAAIRSVAGKTPVGLQGSEEERRRMRELGIVKTPADLGIDVATATRDRLAAKNIMELVEWSGGLYDPPAKFLPRKEDPSRQ
ncbi:malonate decarboxylase subunit alpha [Pyramidobacter piscolens]|uniref:malonate decarboxylase subunit alpha n=1 Tax=Pyramidobacter piscolens TaxID=638849 RepID=UPI003AF65E7D